MNGNDSKVAQQPTTTVAAQEAVAYCHYLPGDNEAVVLFNKQTGHGAGVSDA